MGYRHLARQRALEFLYALEFASPDETYEAVEQRWLEGDKHRKRGWVPFAQQLARSVHERRGQLDDQVRPLLHNWKLERLPVIDRNCLRMAVCELEEFSDIPLRVTINEYIELSRRYSTDESPQYINAVLDPIARNYPEKDFQRKSTPDTEALSPVERPDEP